MVCGFKWVVVFVEKVVECVCNCLVFYFLNFFFQGFVLLRLYNEFYLRAGIYIYIYMVVYTGAVYKLGS